MSGDAEQQRRTDDRGRKTRTTEARDKRRGIPQGSPLSPPRSRESRDGGSASARVLHQAPDRRADALVRAMGRHRTAGAGSGSSRTPRAGERPRRFPRGLGSGKPRIADDVRHQDRGQGRGRHDRTWSSPRPRRCAAWPPASAPVHIIDRPDLPFLGVGEAGQGPAAAAIANAIADATGQRLRDLPLTAAKLKAAVGI